MSGWKKLAAASAAGGAGLNVEDVFSTYVYTGTNTTNAINNGIDLDGESGIVWIKNRDQADNHYIFGGESGNNWTKLLTPNGNGYYGGATGVFDSVSSTGFTVKSDFGGVNTINENYVSWTFRKAPKFFDVVTYTGDGTTPQTINHNLGVEPGCIIIKRTDGGTTNWQVYHRGLNGGVNPEQYGIQLNLTNAQGGDFWLDTAPTSTEFTVTGGQQVGGSGMTYVAYLFAHHDGDGTFGATGDQDIIKCGSYTGSNSQELNIGFEPQWIMIKRTDVAASWIIYDNIRGMADRNSSHLYANSSAAEVTNTLGSVMPTAQGIQFDANTIGEINSGGDDFIYIAIRRGPMAVPESATDVFAIDTYGGTLPNPPTYNSGFEVDMALARDVNSNDNWELCTRQLKGSALRPNLNYAQDTGVGVARFDYNDGWRNSSGTSTDYYSWMWRRAPNFFDVVTYTGAYSASGLTINHNLGVVPEMIWVKSRNATGNWYVYHANVSADPETDYLVLNEDNDVGDNIYWNDTAPTDTQFFVNAQANSNGDTYIACLFASLDGISKVGSYTGNGSSQTIDCGFSNGARFVLIKRTDISRDWYLWDSERGIVSGNDPHLSLNTTASEVTTNDSIDPASSGFVVNQVGTLPGINVSSGSYVFYAIA